MRWCSVSDARRRTRLPAPGPRSRSSRSRASTSTSAASARSTGRASRSPKGSITALIGPNGAGKTTLFNVVTGFYRPDAARIVYGGESIFGKPPYSIARRGMVRTFQITKALSAMPVIDNMMLAAPAQPGEHLLGAARPARREPAPRGGGQRAGDGAARDLQPRRQGATTTPARSRAASASCSSWRGR